MNHLHRLPLLTILTLMAGSVQPAYAWGERGHQAVGEIAQIRLNKRAREGCRRLLGPDFSLAKVSTWADEIKRERGFTRPWHYVNIPITAAAYDPARHCPEGNCILGKLPRLIRQINDPAISRLKRREALMFVVHLVGDLHQPLHCGDRGDRGGNDVAIANPMPKVSSNLHRLWDFGAIEREGLTLEQLVQASGEALRKKPLRRSKRLEFDLAVVRWAMEAHDLSRDHAYAGVPTEGSFTVTDKYHRRVLRISQRQIGVAGARLAAILNQVFAK